MGNSSWHDFSEFLHPLIAVYTVKGGILVSVDAVDRVKLIFFPATDAVIIVKLLC